MEINKLELFMKKNLFGQNNQANDIWPLLAKVWFLTFFSELDISENLRKCHI